MFFVLLSFLETTEFPATFLMLYFWLSFLYAASASLNCVLGMGDGARECAVC